MIDLDDIRQDIIAEKEIPKVIYVYREDTQETQINFLKPSSEFISISFNSDALPYSLNLELVSTTDTTSVWKLVIPAFMTAVMQPKTHNFTITVELTSGQIVTLYKGLLAVNNRVFSNYANNAFVAPVLKTVAPTELDSAYLNGSFWIDTFAKRVYVLMSNVSQNAVWEEIVKRSVIEALELNDALQDTRLDELEPKVQTLETNVTDLQNNKVNKTQTIAGVDLRDDITKQELKVALDVDKSSFTNSVEVQRDQRDYLRAGVLIDNGSKWEIDRESQFNLDSELKTTRFGMATIGTKMYIIGGRLSYTNEFNLSAGAESKIISYDFSTKKWAVEYDFLKELNGDGYDFLNNGVSTYGNEIFVMAGDKRKFYKTSSNLLIRFRPFKYNVVTKAFTELTRNDDYRVTNGAVQKDGKIYITYGQKIDLSNRLWILANEVVYENAYKQETISVVTLPINANDLESIVSQSAYDETYDGTIFKITDGTNSVYYSIAYNRQTSIDRRLKIYDIATDTWSFGAIPPEATSTFWQQGVSTLVGNDIYVKRSNYHVKYNIPTDTWTVLSSPIIANVHTESPVHHDGYIYYAGGWVSVTQNGFDGTQNSGVVQRYNIATDTWELHSVLPKLLGYEQGYGGLYLSGTTLYYISGYSNDYDGAPFANKHVYSYNLTQGVTYDPTYNSRIDVDDHGLKVNVEDIEQDIQSHISSTNNPHGVTKAQVGLDNVDNTSDANKPVSTAQQTALNGKENAFTKNTAFNKNFGTTDGTVAQGNHLHTGVYEPANANIQSHISSTNNPHSVTKSQVGLGNVDNTSDETKYVQGLRETRANVNTKIWTGTQVQYDAIVTKDATTLYFITE